MVGSQMKKQIKFVIFEFILGSHIQSVEHHEGKMFPTQGFLSWVGCLARVLAG